MASRSPGLAHDMGTMALIHSTRLAEWRQTGWEGGKFDRYESGRNVPEAHGRAP